MLFDFIIVRRRTCSEGEGREKEGEVKGYMKVCSQEGSPLTLRNTTHGINHGWEEEMPARKDLLGSFSDSPDILGHRGLGESCLGGGKGAHLENGERRSSDLVALRI